jgi:hypothetical protein
MDTDKVRKGGIDRRGGLTCEFDTVRKNNGARGLWTAGSYSVKERREYSLYSLFSCGERPTPGPKENRPSCRFLGRKKNSAQCPNLRAG